MKLVDNGYGTTFMKAKHYNIIPHPTLKLEYKKTNKYTFCLM